MPLVILGASAVFTVRLWQLQIVQGEFHRERALSASTRTVSTLAPRGEIFDRQGRLVAGVKTAWVVRANPSIVLKNPKKEAERISLLLADASRVLELSPEEIENRLKQADNKALPTDLLVNATAAQAIKIAEQPHRFPGFEVQVRALREVRETTALSHILGYVGRPNEAIINQLKEQEIVPADYVGRDGLERVYEKELMGRTGTLTMSVDSRGRPLQQTKSESPTPGSRLFLTLDLDLQKEAQRLMGARKGAIVALDPKTGDVLAFVSAPTYDLSLFEGGISRADYARLAEDPGKPLMRRPSQGLYSPGSTFKIITALAAARQGLLGHSEYCPGFKTVGNRRVRCGNHSPGLTQGFEAAFRTSCNSYFVALALKVGPEEVAKAARDLGLGLPTNIDLPSEFKGSIPDGEVVKELGGRSRPWYLGDTANMGIGQGGVLVTPLQMAQVMMRVADNGRAPVPRVVRAVQGADDKSPRLLEPKMAEPFSAPDVYWSRLKNAMESVISRGTAKRAQIPGLTWGGKTGSTEHSRSNRTHSWFVGMAPIDDPQIVIAVLSEQAGHGGEVSAPIAGGVVRKFFELQEARRSDSASSMARRQESSSS